MALTIQDVIDRVRDQLQDAPEFGYLSLYRYEDSTLRSYIALAYNTLLRLKPTIMTERVLHVCTAAPRQRLDPAAHYRLMRVDCNSTAAAPLHGDFIQTVERDVIDTFYSSWPASEALPGEEPTRFKAACLDAKDPLAFWLFPTPRVDDEVWVLASYIPDPPPPAAVSPTHILTAGAAAQADPYDFIGYDVADITSLATYGSIAPVTLADGTVIAVLLSYDAGGNTSYELWAQAPGGTGLAGGGTPAATDCFEYLYIDAFGGVTLRNDASDTPGGTDSGGWRWWIWTGAVAGTAAQFVDTTPYDLYFDTLPGGAGGGLFAFPDEYVAPIVDLVCCIASISVGKDEPAQHSARYLTNFLGALGISTKILGEIGVNQLAAPEATE